MENMRMVLDYENGKNRIGGDAQIFNLILGEYLKENIDVLEDLKKNINNNDYLKAIEIVHKNKSSSGNIGATSLYDCASEFQKALQEKDQEGITKNHNLFNELLGKLFEEIKDIIN